MKVRTGPSVAAIFACAMARSFFANARSADTPVLSATALSLAEARSASIAASVEGLTALAKMILGTATDAVVIVVIRNTSIQEFVCESHHTPFWLASKEAHLWFLVLVVPHQP